MQEKLEKDVDWPSAPVTTFRIFLKAYRNGAIGHRKCGIIICHTETFTLYIQRMDKKGFK